VADGQRMEGEHKKGGRERGEIYNVRKRANEEEKDMFKLHLYPAILFLRYSVLYYTM